jgi:hypothetical protein
MKRLVEVSQLK